MIRALAITVSVVLVYGIVTFAAAIHLLFFH